MKRIMVGLLSLLSIHAHAGLVYKFSAEVNGDGLFNDGTPLTGSFTYDPNGPLVETLPAGPPNFGPFLRYAALNDLSAKIDGLQLEVGTGRVFVTNIDPDPSFPDRRDGLFPQVASDDPGWSGFEKNGQILAALTFQLFLAADFLPNALLPAELPLEQFNANGPGVIVSMVFNSSGNAAGPFEQEVFFRNLQMQVPEPGTLGMMGAGLFILGVMRRKRAA